MKDIKQWTINHSVDGWPVCYGGVRLEKKDLVDLTNRMEVMIASQGEMIESQKGNIRRLEGIIEYGLGPEDLEDDH